MVAHLSSLKKQDHSKLTAFLLILKKLIGTFVLRMKNAISINEYGSTQVRYPAQQDSSLTSLLKVWAQSFKPSTIVR